jgi:hypothetical protein
MRMAHRAAGVLITILAATLSASAQGVALVAELDGAEALPPTASPSKGTAVFALDPVANTLSYELALDYLSASETAAHIHGYAAPGASAGVVHTLPLGRFKQGVWNYPESAESKILSGLTYVNVHTAAHGGGEIRGQIVVETGDATLFISMSGANEVPPNSSPAKGVGFFSMDLAANSAHYQVTVTESLLLGAELYTHAHGFAPPGQNVPAQHTMPLGFHKKGTWVYTNAQEPKILASLSSGNVHSQYTTVGEIRGHFVLQNNCVNPSFTNYCTAGSSANGCVAQIDATGVPSATLPEGFKLNASGVEGTKTGLFFYGVNGRQALPYGSGTSYVCVVQPTKRGSLRMANGTAGLCDGGMNEDLNARWCPSCPKPAHNPGAGTVVQAQLWYRDPHNTSNQVTSLSDGLEFTMCP